MPRAASSSTDAGPSHLRRNQACHQCRKKKLKCDAQLPCSACTKTHASLVRLHPFTAPNEPDCTYDTVEDLIPPEAKRKIAQLEARIEELEEIVRRKDIQMATCKCGSIRPNSTLSGSEGPSVSPSSTTAEVPQIITPPQPLFMSGTIFPMLFFPQNEPVPFDLPSLGRAPEPPSRIFTSPGPSTALQFTDWPINVPPPDLLLHLVDTFFASAPFANRLLHRPTFMQSLQLPPSSLSFPHIALLHAICAMASLYSPLVTDIPGDISIAMGPTAFFHSGVQPLLVGPEPSERYNPRNIEDILNIQDMGFGGSQIKWCMAAVRAAGEIGDRLLQLLQACVIGCWYSYSSGQSVATHTWLGSACRLALPLGLTMSDGFEPLSRLPPTMLKRVQDARTNSDMEMAVNSFWVAFSLDKVYTSITAWPASLGEEDCSQILPIRLSDFVSGSYVSSASRQTLHATGAPHPSSRQHGFLHTLCQKFDPTRKSQDLQRQVPHAELHSRWWPRVRQHHLQGPSRYSGVPSP